MKQKFINFLNELNIKKYSQIEWLITYLFLLIIFIKRSLILNIIFNINVDGWKLIKSYLETFLSWPVIVLIISLMFIVKFSDSIKIFIENIKSFKVGPVETSQNQRTSTPQDIEREVVENLEEKGITFTQEQLGNIEQHIDNLSNQVQVATTESQNKDEMIKYLAERAELFEFAYLNYYLVFNTKQTLLWFNNIPLKTSTKENFLYGCFLQIQVPNIIAEKEAIFSTLLVNNLLQITDQQTYKITEKGERFLKYVGLLS
jgi:hypothetical protein